MLDLVLFILACRTSLWCWVEGICPGWGYSRGGAWFYTYCVCIWWGREGMWTVSCDILFLVITKLY